ncbi:hypothetical protein CC78DRAFT_541885 [Lojkania enalia]|uniref:Uncharacterized protein n=1 Tax=Lojkania enalia TaxID=147567 RepID=A0A9P4KGF2_9PLEO|nr:hypothetical protein CC78DRAFT_541885 [Didymosphaeria enalia]
MERPLANSTLSAVGNTEQPTAWESTSSGTDAISPASTQVLPTPEPSAKSGVSGGAVAGIAIACLIAGAATGAAILFLLFRRKRKTQIQTYQQRHIPYIDGAATSEKRPAVVDTAVSSNVDHFLPQPVEDDAITKELSRIRDNIKNHVRSYYHYEPIRQGDINASMLGGLAAATGLQNTVLIDLISNPSTRSGTIRLFIAWIALSRCDGNTLPNFLPDELAPLAVAIPGKDATNSVQSTLYSKWKTITGALLQQKYRNQAVDTTRATAQAIAQIDAFLAPLLQQSIDGGQRRRNLEMILSRAAHLAFLLFSQPGSYRFDYAPSRGKPVIFPALLQVIDDQAHCIDPPRVLWEREDVEEGGIGVLFMRVWKLAG